MTAMRVDSYQRIIDPDASRPHETDFVQCCHCGAHHAFRSTLDAHLRGERRLGFCAKCSAPCCLTCSECVPIEQQLTNLEAGRHVLTSRPVLIAVPRDVPG